MRLRKLLIGSTAAIFAGGVASTAQAADPQGLVVTSMANYVEQCNNGRGWTKGPWCITIGGTVEWEIGYGYELDYGDDPWDTTIDTVGTGGPWTGFSGLSLSSFNIVATRPSDKGTITVSVPIRSGSPTLTIGPWRFNSNGVRYQQSFGPAQVTVTVQNPGTLGWTDPRTGGPVGGSSYRGAGPWPDAQFEVGFDAGFADLDFGVNVGQRFIDGVAWSTPWLTVGGYAQAELGVGPADVTLRFDFDRVNAANDGTEDPIWAWGIRLDTEFDIGDRVTLEGALGYSRNYGYGGGTSGTRYPYNEHNEGSYLYAMAGLTFEVNDLIEVGADVTYWSGPLRPDDRVLEIGGNITLTPSSITPVEIEFEVEHQRQLGGNNLNATNFSVTVGVTF